MSSPGEASIHGRTGISIGVLLLVAACGGGVDPETVTSLESRVLELERQNAALEVRLEEARAALNPTAATPITIEGELHLLGSQGGNQNFSINEDGCAGTRGYADLNDQYQLQLKDQAGRLLSFATLGRGGRYGSGALGTDYGRAFCRWQFSFADVDLTGVTTVIVASRRGEVLFSADEARRFGVALVIGGD